MSTPCQLDATFTNYQDAVQCSDTIPGTKVKEIADCSETIESGMYKDIYACVGPNTKYAVTYTGLKGLARFASNMVADIFGK